MSLDLLILESPWDPIGRDPLQASVLGYFESLEKLHGEFNVHYGTFMREESFRDSLCHLVGNNRRKILYIASHGESDSVGDIPLSSLVQTLRDVLRETNRRLDGIIFGSCHVGINNEQMLALLSGNVQESPSLRWVFGYNKAVNWVQSTLIDMHIVENLINHTAGYERNTALKIFSKSLNLFNKNFRVGADGRRNDNSIKDSIELYLRCKHSQYPERVTGSLLTEYLNW